MRLTSARLRVLAMLAGYLVLVVGSGAWMAANQWRAGHPWRAAVFLVVGLAVYALIARILFVRLRDIRHAEEEIATADKPYDETVWGVGGPAMRTPGETGILKRPHFR